MPLLPLLRLFQLMQELLLRDDFLLEFVHAEGLLQFLQEVLPGPHFGEEVNHSELEGKRKGLGGIFTPFFSHLHNRGEDEHEGQEDEVVEGCRVRDLSEAIESDIMVSHDALYSLVASPSWPPGPGRSW